MIPEIKTLEAKWFDPACYRGCQSLILKKRITELENLVGAISNMCHSMKNFLNKFWWIPRTTDEWMLISTILFLIFLLGGSILVGLLKVAALLKYVFS